MIEFTEKFLALMKNGTRFVLATVVKQTGSSPRDLGARMAILSDGGIIGTIGGGALEHFVMEKAPDVLEGGSPVTLDFNLAKDLDMACGGAVSVLLEPFGPRDRAVICGGGHIARELCEILARCGMEVWIADGRPGFASREHFPKAHRLLGKLSPETVVVDLELDQDKHRDFVVVVTNSHALDKALVLEMLPLDRLAYLGMVASRSKAAAARRAAEKRGLDQERIEFLNSPVGLPIGGASPGEIAVSIAAEIQAVRYGKLPSLAEAVAVAAHPQGSETEQTTPSQGQAEDSRERDES